MKIRFSIVLLLCVFATSAFQAHKFYVAIFQVNFAQEKKMLQITSRVFIDDLNDVLELKYKVKGQFGEPRQSVSDEQLLEQYFADNLKVWINGKPATLNYKSCEIENNVLISYFSVPGINKIKTLEISNKILTDLVTEQQNIIQTSINGKKASQLLTAGNDRVKLSY